MDTTPPKKSRQRSSTTITNLMREYGLPDTMVKAGKKALRYRQPAEKGIYWYWFARFIRMRDAYKWGRCISCDQPKTFSELQAGHFAPARDCGFAMLFDQANVHGECGGCNAYDEAHLWGYEKNLDKRYGADTGKALRVRYEMRNSVITKEWSRYEYAKQIPKIKELYFEYEAKYKSKQNIPPELRPLNKAV